MLHFYLRAKRIDAAIKLGEHYPDDFAPMQYGKVLALHLAGREEDARTLLRQLRKVFPEVYKMLISPNPRRPAITEGRVTMGGKDEAWFYREDYLDIWQQSGGLDWLRKNK